MAYHQTKSIVDDSDASKDLTSDIDTHNDYNNGLIIYATSTVTHRR